MLDKYLSDPTVRTVIFAILGLGLASIFRKTCDGKRCVVIKAPNPDDVEGKVFKFDSGCYTFQPKIVSCGGN
jgi:hypothetical protein